MRLTTIAVVLVGFAVGASLAAPKKRIRLYAQTVPFVAHATWNPNAASDAVSFYTVTLDGGASQQVPASSCAATCATAVSIPSFGNHTVAVTATNFLLSTDPTAPQTGPPATVAFSLNQAPKAVSGATVGR